MKSGKFAQSMWLAGLGAAVAAVAVAPVDAEAGTPQTSQYVETAGVSVEPNYQIEDLSLFVGIDECESLAASNPNISATWETNVDIADNNLFGGVYHYRFDRGEESQIACRDSDGDLHTDCQGELPDDDVTRTPPDVDASIDFETLTDISDSSECTDEELDRSHYIQLRLRDYVGGNTSDWQYSEVRVVVDLIRPGAPVLTDALATESSIRVEFDRSESDDVERHLVFYSTQSFEEGQPLDEVTDRSPRAVEGEEPTEGTVSFDLEGDQEIYIGMVSRDRAGNFSTVSAPLQAQVVETEGFWDRYVEAGGAEAGGYGCTAADVGGPVRTVVWFAAFLLAIAGLRVVWRRPGRNRKTIRVDDEVRR